jgi:hypothetical protein
MFVKNRKNTQKTCSPVGANVDLIEKSFDRAPPVRLKGVKALNELIG